MSDLLQLAGLLGIVSGATLMFGAGAGLMLVGGALLLIGEAVDRRQKQ